MSETSEKEKDAAGEENPQPPRKGPFYQSFWFMLILTIILLLITELGT